MSDLSVVADRGQWLLVDGMSGHIDAYPSREEALHAASAWANRDTEPCHVLIHEDGGEWGEALVEPTRLH